MSEVSREGPLDFRVQGQAQICLSTIPHQGDGQATEIGHRATETTATVSLADRSHGWSESFLLISGMVLEIICASTVQWNTELVMNKCLWHHYKVIELCHF